MIRKPKIIVLRTAGTNCDGEMAFAFEKSGGEVDLVHVNQLLRGEVHLQDYHILAIPGGFTYGDDIASGRILANELNVKLGQQIGSFIADGKLMIGVCNGFQVMIKAGFLPGGLASASTPVSQTATLTFNDSGKFEDRWVHLKVEGKSVWTQGLDNNILYLPVAHAEGKFVTIDQDVLECLKTNGQVAFRYCSSSGGEPHYPDNPNGSVEDIAGITDKTGRILGLMPHPERHFLSLQHPSWTRQKHKGTFGDGARIFQNGVDYINNNLLSKTTVSV
ncbi:MAG: phosphoribosylformylglycinamidine synthase I [Candidatus Omnitrophota bacterium]|nr:phosphoribosylformylglycinamidine synthase I [Candidatus Omnitrophota bacterium]